MLRGNVRVRLAEPGDVGTFVSLVQEMRGSISTSPKHARDAAGAHDALSGRFDRLLRNDGAVVLLAVDAGTDEPMGFALVTEDEVSALAGTPALHLGHLFVQPQHRRRGAGRALVAAAATQAEAIGCDHVMVGVTTGGRDANRFFARLGFAPLVTRRIATVATLRRTLGLAEYGVDRAGMRRRALRPVRRLARPAPIHHLRGGGAA